tara:strand:+ start:5300 stop:5572 length:273 start_codon:yes stop_codon:yes gene_type:complete
MPVMCADQFVRKWMISHLLSEVDGLPWAGIYQIVWCGARLRLTTFFGLQVSIWRILRRHFTSINAICGILSSMESGLKKLSETESSRAAD